MNLDFNIREAGGSGGRTAVVGMRAVQKDLQEFIKGLVERAAKEGQRVAEAEAPRGKSEPRDGRRIVDSIKVGHVHYSPGGLGGGGSYEVELYADGAIAPHLRYVYEGTANEGTGFIRPAKGNIAGVLAIEKEGEGVHFRRWARGQKPQREWWRQGQRAAEEVIAEGIRTLRIDNRTI